MYRQFGKTPGQTCGTCSNFVSGRYHIRTLRQCSVYGLTHSEASDWAKRWESCCCYNKEETGVEPIAISCSTREGIETFKEELRKIVNPRVKFHHTHAEKPDIADMPDTTGDEIPADAMRFATFLKLDKPKAKSHPSRGNIH